MAPHMELAKQGRGNECLSACLRQIHPLLRDSITMMSPNLQKNRLGPFRTLPTIWLWNMKPTMQAH